MAKKLISIRIDENILKIIDRMVRGDITRTNIIEKYLREGLKKERKKEIMKYISYCLMWTSIWVFAMQMGYLFA